MPLIEFKTSLKSLKFGKDRPYGGSSNQPYIQSSIPEGDIPTSGGPDFILRGGILAPISAAKDVSRLTQMFFDLKSPNGALFTVKENLLSKTSVQVEAPDGIKYALGLNQGEYLPTSTIAQAGVGFAGTHLNLFGLNPTNGIIRYEDVVINNNKIEDNLGFKFTQNPNPTNPFPILSTEKSPFSNRLLKFWDEKQINTEFSQNLYSYSGGPGSILGFGNTNIAISKQRTNVNTQFNGNFSENNKNLIYKSFYYNPEQIASQTQNLSSISKISEDFRKTLIDSNNITGSSYVLSTSPSYLSKNIEQRNHLGDPGQQKNILNYGVDAASLTALDKINALPMYTSEGPNHGYAINDIVKFRIAAINNDSKDGRQAVYMHFRAFIDSFDDNFSATWNPVKYSGRGDTLYNYQGFERSVNMSFTVYAQSKAELIPMYRKLNYLASTLAPDYTGAGFMRGNLVRLTLGGYLYEQPGFITSLTYSIPEESSWEIGIDENGNSDNSVKELPHMIKVTGLTFTPIHTFLPQKPNSDIVQRNKNGKYSSIPEKYIALAAGGSEKDNNYSDYYGYYNSSNANSPYIESAGAPSTPPAAPSVTTDTVGPNSVANPSNILNI
jgi:hypothetical protein